MHVCNGRKVYVNGPHTFLNGEIEMTSEETEICVIEDELQFLKSHLSDIIKEMIVNREINVPAHLVESALEEMDNWVHSIILADRVYKENTHYILKKDKMRHTRIVPVEYETTGTVGVLYYILRISNRIIQVDG